MPITQSIQQAQQRPATIDAIAKGVQVAKQLLGVDVDTKRLELEKQRRDAEMEAKRIEAENAAAAANPDSPLSQSVRKNAQAGGLRIPGNASAKDLEKGSLLYESILAQRKAELERQGKSAQLSNEKRLPADKVLAVNEGNVIPSLLSDLKQTIAANQGDFGPVSGRWSSLNPWNDKAKTMDAQLRSSAQAFGRYMEGGVLRKEDEEKYMRMFPQLSDTPGVAQNKLELVDRLLKQKQASNLQALKGSGYDTRGVEGVSDLDAPGVPSILTRGNQNEGKAIAGGDNFSAEDVAAFQWAKQNMKDPRAKEIAMRLRAKGLK